jgi:hypothetical protein
MFTTNKVEVTVLRLKCKNCNKTHAVLDCNIIPYCQYSLSFILEVLASFFINKDPVDSICNEFGISNSTFKMFSDYYHRELVDLKSYFEDGSLSDNELFEELINSDIEDFLVSFFCLTKRHLFHFIASNTFSKYKIRTFHITFFAI